MLWRYNSYNFMEITSPHWTLVYCHHTENFKRIVSCAVSRVPFFAVQMMNLHVYGSL